MATSTTGAYEGAGGKFKRKPFRRAVTTPYDRPQTAIRNPIQAARNGWLSKLVDPASRVISRSAQMLFSSMFRKRLPAPPLVSEATREPREEIQQANTISPCSGGQQEQVSNEGANPSNGFENNGINEIEQVLKQKTFTKAEIDRLTELLRSRTVAAPAENEKGRSEPTSHVAAAHDRWELASFPVQENMEGQRSLGGISTPTVYPSVPEPDIASPAELAKAYMGSMPSKVSPSTLGLRSQAFRKDVALPTTVPYTPKTSSISLAPMSSAGVSENGYIVPRSRGRSAIYNMARTPYSRVPGTATRNIDSYVSPSPSSQWSMKNNSLSGGKQASKRRISILDNDIGSVGPIRRIRQKTNFMSPPKNLSLPTSGSPLYIPATANGSDIAQSSSMSLMQRQPLLDERKHNVSNMGLAENDDNRIPETSSAFVPAQSSEMAKKILQQLDKLVPSPKEKLSELKLAVAREKSPTKLTQNMLRGQALRSLENVDSSKLLRDVPYSDNFEAPGGTHLRDARDLISQKQDKFDSNGPTQFAASGDKLAPKANGLGSNLSFKENVPTFKASESTISSSATCPPQKKRAFRMSAHEDFVDMDDDSYSGRVALTTENEKLDTSVVEIKATGAETGTIEKPSVSSSEIKFPTSAIMNKVTESKSKIAPTIAEKDGSFTFPSTPAASTVTQLSSPAPQVSSFINEAAPPKETTAPPMFSFGLKGVDKASPFQFSSTSSGVGESSSLVFGAPSKLETQSSSAIVTSTVSDTLKAAKSDEGDKPQKGRDLFGRAETVIPLAVSPSPIPNIFSSEASTKNPSINNESLSIPSLASAPATTQVSNGSSDKVFSAASSTSTTVASTSSSLSIAAAMPTFSAASVFKFGSSSAAVLPSNSASLPSATSGVESTNSEPKDKQASLFGSFTSSPFGASSSSALTSTGSGIFGFSASTPSSTTNMPSSTASNKSTSSNPFSTGADSLFGSQVTSTETKTAGVAPFAQSMPNPFGFSSSSSASSSFSSGSSLFCSATPAANIFGSGSGFGASSSASTGASSFSSGSGTSLFGSSLQSGASSVFGSGFGSASSATGFSFGASSAAAAPAGTAPMQFGSSLGASSAPIFSFTSATATTSLPPSGPVFGTSSPAVPFGSNPQSNDQMNMEDSMAEDTIQASTPVVPTFGQPANSLPPATFMFGSAAPTGGSPFQFGSQQNLGTPQNPSPFQSSGNLEFSAGGSFSLGTGGGDKSNRKIVRVKRDKTRRR